MCGFRAKAALAFWVIFIIFPFFIGNVCALSTTIVPFGEVCLEVYVIALDGVDGHGVSNITRVVDGVFGASKPRDNATRCIIEPPPDLVLGEVKINITVIVVRGWDEYGRVVETCARAIIVNAHGETIPIPSGYMREEWIDKIAEAMAHRNVTWVHTAGYPFYYCYHQEGGEDKWGEEGFKRLMGHIGKNNVTCHSPYPYEDMVLASLDLSTIGMDWGYMIPCGQFASRGKPLNGPQFKDCRVATIWGDEDTYMTGAIIKFAKTDGINSFGFYVHIGTYKTYRYDSPFADNRFVETDADYVRAYVGAGAAMWTCAWRFAAEEAIANAEGAIAKAELEGRTKGLDYAKIMVQEAKSLVRHRPLDIVWRADDAILKAIEAKSVADNAVKPSFLEAYTLPLAVLGLMSATVATGLAIKRRNNLKNKRGNQLSQAE